MCSRFQAAALVASPSHPNCIAWSDENLIAVASGHLVTILNPELPLGPRGLIKVPAGEILPIGLIPRQDLLSDCLLPSSLSRDRDPCVRAISWSPLGMAPNSGCLIAICTVEGRVKLYRPPFCDYSAEWIEIMDVTEHLYVYLAGFNFREDGVPSPTYTNMSEEHESSDDQPIIPPKRERRRRRSLDVQPNIPPKRERRGRRSKEPGTIFHDNDVESDANSEELLSPDDNFNPDEMQENELSEGFDDELEDSEDDQIWKGRPNSQAKRKNSNKKKTEAPKFLITVKQYASRSAMLSSTVVSWSPLLQLSSRHSLEYQNQPPSFCLLAVGGKSGDISFWRIDVPTVYTVENGDMPPPGRNVGYLQAHNSWITSISWTLLTSDSSVPQVLLATGSSNGSVKIWLGYPGEFLESPESTSSPFNLLKEIITADMLSSPISVLSLTIPVKSPHEVLLAVGRGSGCFEVWTWHRQLSTFEKIASSEMHDHVVTGLAWASDGWSLYSCSQDNILRSWRITKGSLCEVLLPSSSPGQRGFSDLPNTFHSCYGVAVSPGSVALALARSFDSAHLNPMYQTRSLKAAVEFFWIGGQETSDISPKTLVLESKTYPGFPKTETACWKFNLLQSLKQYESTTKPLVVWDIIAALLAFKRISPEYVDHILLEWLSASSYLGTDDKLSAEAVCSELHRSFSNYTCRQLQLLYVIIRRVALSELKADEINSKIGEKEGKECEVEEEEDVNVWLEIVLGIEKEIRERLVGLSFSASLSLLKKKEVSLNGGYWSPTGLAQMEQWTARGSVREQLKSLSSDLRNLKKRLRLSGEYQTKEKCSYCSAPVPFESAETGFCKGGKDTHKLVRCGVSMQTCPVTFPLWYCICCQRRVLKLAPEVFFTMIQYPEDFTSLHKSLEGEVVMKPMCPFCGVLLQRLQPDFLLSPMPV